MMSHIEIAVLLRVNELAARYGVKPYDFTTTCGYNESGEITLSYDAICGNKKRVMSMIQSTGAIDGELKGNEIAIIDALDAAIRKAPRAVDR